MMKMLVLDSAKLCEAAYSPDLGKKPIVMGNYIIEPEDMIESGNAKGFVTKHNNWVDVVVAGTNDFRDAFRDAQIHMIYHPIFGLVHAGINSEYESLKPMILDKIKHGDRVLFHGHSLGGGIVVQGAADVSLIKGVHTLSCITFGQPMIFGSDRFKGLNLLRIRNPKDRVPQQPTRWARYVYKRATGISVAPYMHVGDECWLTPDGKEEPTWWPWQYRLHGIKDYIKGVREYYHERLAG